MEVIIKYTNKYSDDKWALKIYEDKFEVHVNFKQPRIYDINNEISSIEAEDEYVTIRFKDESFLSIKFEDNCFFVADIYDCDGMYEDSFASWDFDDDYDYCLKYPDSEALPDEDGKCSLCGGDCVI